MKINLAENLLRFGAKNLSEESKKKLAEQTYGPAAGLSKFSGVDKWLDSLLTTSAQMQPNQIYTDTVGNYVVTYKTAKEVSQAGGGSGKLNVYTMASIGGWPILKNVATLTNSQGAQWRDSGDSLYTSNDIVDVKTIPGNSSPEKFNTYWATLKDYVSDPSTVTLEFLNNCIKLATKKSANLQQLFKLNNSNNPSTQKPYSSETGVPFNRTQYYLLIDSKITDKTARSIYNVIKDPAIIKALGGTI